MYRQKLCVCYNQLLLAHALSHLIGLQQWTGNARVLQKPYFGAICMFDHEYPANERI
ncbi:MAG: hypothetical protein WAV47_02800 [Blastocatellia bacterium]